MSLNVVIKGHFEVPSTCGQLVLSLNVAKCRYLGRNVARSTCGHVVLPIPVPIQGICAATSACSSSSPAPALAQYLLPLLHTEGHQISIVSCRLLTSVAIPVAHVPLFGIPVGISRIGCSCRLEPHVLIDLALLRPLGLFCSLHFQVCSCKASSCALCISLSFHFAGNPPCLACLTASWLLLQMLHLPVPCL